MKLLIVEDEEPKQKNINNLIQELSFACDVDFAKSVSGALRTLRVNSYNLIILDMSLPTFDIGNGEYGGRPQGFGGQEVLRYMDRLKIETPVIVVTAFEAFAGQGRAVDLKSLSISLKVEHPKIFKGVVFYNTEFLLWRDSLRELIASVLEDK